MMDKSTKIPVVRVIQVHMMSKKSFQVVPHLVQLDVIGTGGGTTPKVVVLRTDQGSYLFNCGEDTQRLLTSNGINHISTAFRASRRKGIQNVFITHNSWENTGGLIGYVLLEELEEVKTKELLTVHGPNSIDSKLMENVQVSRGCHRFERRRLSEGPYEDYICRIDHVILKKEKKMISEEGLDSQQTTAKLGEINPVLDTQNGTQTDEETDHDIAVAYIIKLKPRPPKIDMAKCKLLGVPKGPLIGKLSRNETVTLPDGREIKPCDVLIDRSEVDKKIIVLDCPSQEYVDSLLSCEELQRSQPPQGDDGDLTEVIVHMSPLTVTQNNRYKAFTDRFGSETTHILLHEDTCPLLYESLYQYSAKLNIICPKIFPRLLPGLESWEDIGTTSGKIIQGHPEMSYNIRGKPGLDMSMCVRCNYERFREEVQREIPHLPAKIEEVYRNIDHQNDLNGTYDRSTSYPEVVFLGTTSACPATYRNVSCILVHTSADSAILLDCGGGSTSQLFQFYGDQFDLIITKVKAVFISHIHADHNSGVVGFIKRRHKAFQRLGRDYKPLWLALPYNYWQWWLRIYNNRDPIMNLCRKIPLKDLDKYDPKEVQQFLQDNNIAKFEPVLVEHCRDAYGVVVTLANGYKLVYSGDTMPCDRLVCAGQDCDLLIHECTFEDYLESYAREKKHSTQSQAIDVGRRMNAKFIILTHFSARYQPFYHLKDAPDNVFAAFDFMKITSEDLPLLKHVREILTTAFVEEIEELKKKEVKFRKRQNDSGGKKDKRKGNQSIGKSPADTKKLKVAQSEQKMEVT